MTARERVERARRGLRQAVLVTALLRGAALTMLLLLLVTFADAVVALDAPVRVAAAVVALAAGAGLTARWLMRHGWRASVDGAALWIEARFPSLRYALVTAVDSRFTGGVPELERAAALVDFESQVATSAMRALRWPVVAVVLFGVLLAALPSGAVSRVTWPRAGDALDRVSFARRRANPLATIVVRVAAPAYAALPEQLLDDPALVRALAGSAVTIEGRTGGTPVRAVAGADTLRAAEVDGRWRATFAMPDAPIAVRLVAGTHERLVAFDAMPDSAPALVLLLPARDSILRRAAGRVPLEARAIDDYGLANGEFDVVVSSGGGENFTFRNATIGATALTGRDATFRGSLDLDGLHLGPGDIVQLRAVARDGNSVGGPALGVSETRTWRVARADEYDSVAVDAAPPPDLDKNALSQRMLLMLAQGLETRRGRLAHGTFVNESRAIAVDQTQLRKRVGQIVFQRLGESEGEEGDALKRRLDKPANADSMLAAAQRANDAAAAAAGMPIEGAGDETPVIAVNQPLLEAYNHMWQASTELEVGEPGRAIPWMRKALDALERARSAERIYLRGKARSVVVDVARVRLQGKEHGTPSARLPRAASDAAHAARLARFDVALTIAASAPVAAADSLLLLRLDALDHDPAAAVALGAAANALRAGGNVTAVMARARRAVAGLAPRRAPLTAWSAPW